MASRWARLSRGSLVAAFAVLTAAVSHTVAGGALPSAQVVALAIAFALIAAIPLTGRRLSLWRTAALVGVSQMLLHGLFSLFGSTVAVAATIDHHGAVAMSMGAGTDLTHPHPEALMLAAHTVAAIATLLLVRRGEQAARDLVELLSLTLTRLARLLETPLVTPAPRRTVRVREARSGLRTVFLGAHTDRGPPAAFGL